MKEKPIVSIIIPTFNRAKLLEEALNSVCKQSFKHWECIVVDDGSSEETKCFMDDLTKRNDRIHYFLKPENETKGAAACRNYGLKKAKGKFIQFLDDDDILDSRKLEEQLKLNPGNETIVICKWGWFKDLENLESRFKHNYESYGNYDKPSRLLRSLGLNNEYLPLHNYLIPFELVEKAGYWNENLGNNDDAEFLTRVILEAKKINFSSSAKVYYRTGSEDSLSNFDDDNKLKSAINSWKIIEQHFSEKLGVKNPIYVLNAKWNLREVAQNNYSHILKEESSFLKISYFKFSCYKVFRRLFPGF